VQAVSEKSDLTVLHASCHRQSIFWSPQLGVKLSDHELIGANWISDEHYSAKGLSGLFHMQPTRNEPFEAGNPVSIAQAFAVIGPLTTVRATLYTSSMRSHSVVPRFWRAYAILVVCEALYRFQALTIGRDGSTVDLRQSLDEFTSISLS
jgi:hypothetical protein